MSRTMWIIVLVGAGVVAAVAIGLIANHGSDSSKSKESAESSYCTDVGELQSSISSLKALDPTSATKSDYEDAVNQVESDWNAVKSSAANIEDATQQQLEDAWNTFKASVDDVPSDASVSDALSDIDSSATTLASDAQAALTGPDC